jgi:hypothetical protein
MAEAGIEKTGDSAGNSGEAALPATVPAQSAGLADLVKLLAGLTPEQVQALMTLAQAMTAKPPAVSP